MAVSLTNLRDGARIELRDPDGVTFQDADIDHAINQAYRKTFQWVASKLQNQFVTTSFISTVANQREYALPSDFLRLKMAEFINADVTAPMKLRVRGVSPNFTGGVNLTTSNQVPEYDFEGSNIVIEPTPAVSQANAIKLTYYQTSTPLVNPGDNIHADFIDIWQDYIVLEAARSCFSQIEALGGRVSNDFKSRVDEAQNAVELSLEMRTLSPKRLRRKGYFQ